MRMKRRSALAALLGVCLLMLIVQLSRPDHVDGSPPETAPADRVQPASTRARLLREPAPEHAPEVPDGADTSLRLFVCDEDGQPIEGAVVQQLTDASDSAGPLDVVGSSDPDGCLTITGDIARLGETWVVVADGCAPRRLSVSRDVVAAFEISDPVRVELSPGVTVTGTVFDREGAPIAGVTVVAVVEHDPDSDAELGSNVPGADRLVALAARPGERGGVVVARVVTDAGGRFRVSALHADAWTRVRVADREWLGLRQPAEARARELGDVRIVAWPIYVAHVAFVDARSGDPIPARRGESVRVLGSMLRLQRSRRGGTPARDTQSYRAIPDPSTAAGGHPLSDADRTLEIRADFPGYEPITARVVMVRASDGVPEPTRIAFTPNVDGFGEIRLVVSPGDAVSALAVSVRGAWGEFDALARAPEWRVGRVPAGPCRVVGSALASGPARPALLLRGGDWRMRGVSECDVPADGCADVEAPLEPVDRRAFGLVRVRVLGPSGEHDERASVDIIVTARMGLGMARGGARYDPQADVGIRGPIELEQPYKFSVAAGDVTVTARRRGFRNTTVELRVGRGETRDVQLVIVPDR